MKRILVIAALVAATSSLAFGQMKDKKAVQQMHQSGSAERAVMQMEHEFAASVEKSDTVTYGRLVGDDYTFTTQDGVVRTKAELIASFKSGELKYESVSFDDIKVRLYGNTAVVIGRSTVKGQNKGQDISGQYRYTRVYVKRRDAGSWSLTNRPALQRHNCNAAGTRKSGNGDPHRVAPATIWPRQQPVA